MKARHDLHDGAFAPKPPLKARGYTVVEVMMALALLGLGAGGVIASQKATLIANTNARNLATANAVAQAWMERMRVDALSWNEQGGVPDLTSHTEWLGNAVSAPQPVGTGWFSPLVSPFKDGQPAGAPQADVMGADLFTGDTTFAPAFCPQVRLTKFSASPQQGLSPLWSYYRMIRVEVRVYWDKSGRQLDCTQALPANPLTSGYGFVTIVSAVTENNSPI